MFVIKPLTRAFVMAGVALSANGCIGLFAPPALTPEIEFVSENEGEFNQPGDSPARIVPGTEINLESLNACWGTIASYDFDLADAASSSDDSNSVSAFLGLLGSPVIAIEEVAAYIFDTEAGQMEWHVLTRGGLSGAGIVIYTGSFELLDGNRIVFDVNRLSFSDPISGTLLNSDAGSGPPFEWLIAINGETLRLEAQGDLADPEDNIDRDGFVYHRFPCP